MRLRRRVERAQNEHAEAVANRSPQVRHWRSAHWRQQPHGPGRKLRRLVFIEAYLAGSRDVPRVRVINR